MQFQRGRDKCSQIYSLMHDRLAPRSRLLLHSPLITSDRGFGLNWNTESLLTFAARAERAVELPGVGVKYRCKIFNLVTVSAITALERFILQHWCSCKSRSRQSQKSKFSPSTLVNSFSILYWLYSWHSKYRIVNCKFCIYIKTAKR